MDVAKLLSVRLRNFNANSVLFYPSLLHPSSHGGLGEFHDFLVNACPTFVCTDSKVEVANDKFDHKLMHSKQKNILSFIKFPCVCALEDSQSEENDIEEERKRIRMLLSEEDKWDRIKRMYSFDDFGLLSPEMRYVIRGGCICTAMGAMFGVMEGIKKAKNDFFRANMASKYTSEHLARRDLVDRMSLSAARCAFRNAIKYGPFSVLYMLGTVTAANYNNKVTVWEHMACAALLGSLSRINFGIKGVAAAGFLGGVLGLFSGCLVKTSMWMSGVTVEEMRYWQHEYYNTGFLSKKVQ